MNMHKNARLTFVRRMELVNDVLRGGSTQAAAASMHRISVPTVRKWVSRFLAQGEAGLHDRSLRPRRSPARLPTPRCSRCQRRSNFPQNRRSKFPQFCFRGSAGLDQERSFRGRPRGRVTGASAGALAEMRERMCSGSNWACSRSR